MAASSARVLPSWREMFPELCQKPSPKAQLGNVPRATCGRGRGAGRQARLVPALLWGLQGRYKGSTAGRRRLSQFIVRPVGSLVEELDRIPLGWGAAAGISHGEKMPAQRAPCTWQLGQITSLFPPPMGEQGADPQHCGGVTAAPQSRQEENKPPQFSWFFPQRVHMPLPSASFHSSLGSAQLSRLQHRLFSLQLVLF